MKHTKSRLLSAALALVLTVSMVLGSAVPAKAEKSHDFDADPIVSVQRLTATATKTAEQKEKDALLALTGAETVTVIVELEAPSVIEKGLKPGTKEAAAYARTLKAEQTSVANDVKSISRAVVEALEKKGNDVSSIASARNAVVKYTYVNAMNGFAVDVPYDVVPMIKNMPGVKNAFVSRTYSLPEVSENEPNMYTSTGMIYSNILNQVGFSGEGTLVGILDTGLDITHEAFANAPESDSLVLTEQVDGTNLNATGETWVSEKIPFTYDYADGDNDVFPRRSNHGNHVAGTVAGKTVSEDGAVTFSGVAPEAQLAIFKVFSDNSNGAKDAWILAALEDVTVICPDVINLSLGSPCGFTSELYTGEETIDQVYNRVYQNGTVLSISAGNEYYFGYNTPYGYGVPYVENPDYGTVGSPSTYWSSLSIASIENTNLITDYFVVDGQTIMYTDTAETEDQMFASLADACPLDYVFVPGYGELSDYEGIDVEGKIAVISRGSTTFVEKQLNAEEMGAVGAIIYNNQPGTINMSIQKGSIPAIFIKQADAQILMNAEVQQVTELGSGASFENDLAWTMSDFSSWGVTPDLQLKPEVTAPGGHIYSALPGNAYGDMSGTSMAAPHASGAAALATQWVDMLYEDYATELQKADYVNALLMSTAYPVPYEVAVNEGEDGEPEYEVVSYYSPRKQGAGLVDLIGVVSTYTFLTGTNTAGNRPKIELGEDEAKKGIYTLTTTINNWSGFELGYNVKVVTQTDTAEEGIITMEPHVLHPEVIGEEHVTVGGGATKRVSVKIKLTDEDREYLEQFPNGTFVEGFLILEADGEESEYNGNTTTNEVNLVAPFMGFYGDWEAAGLMDKMADSLEWPEHVYGGAWSWKDYADYYQLTGKMPFIGANTYDPTMDVADPIDPKYNMIASDSYYRIYVDILGPQYAPYLMQDTDAHMGIVAITLPLKRNADWFRILIEDDETGDVYLDYEYAEQLPKLYDGDALSSFAEIDWGTYNDMSDSKDALPEGTVVKVTATASLGNGDPDSVVSYFTVDNTAPSIVGYEDGNIPVDMATTRSGKKFLIFKATDNYYLADVEVGQMVGSGNRRQFVEFDRQVFYPEEAGEVEAITFEVTDMGDVENYTVLLHDFTGWEASYTLNPNGDLVLTPARTTVAAGGTVNFTVADASGFAIPMDDPELTWDVEGATSEDTAIEAGVLTVGEDETSRELTVKVNYAGAYDGTAVVTVNRLFNVTLTVNGEGTVTPELQKITGSGRNQRISYEPIELPGIAVEGSVIRFTTATDAAHVVDSAAVNGEAVEVDANGQFLVTVADDTDVVVDFGDFGGAKLYGKNVVLNSALAAKFYLEVEDENVVNEAMVAVTYKGETTYTAISELPTARMEGKTMRVVSVKSAAKEMRENININVVRPFDGGYADVAFADYYNEDITGGYDYSIEAYLLTAMQSTDETVAALAASTNNYGKYVQKFLKYKADEVEPDASLIEYVTADLLQDYAKTIAGAVEGFEDTGSNLVFGDMVSIKFYFEADTLDDLIVTIDGEEVVPVEAGDEYYVEIKDIPADDYGKLYEFSVSRGEETYTKTYGVFSYCYSKIANANTKPATADLCKAMYDYYMKAEAYQAAH